MNGSKSSLSFIIVGGSIAGLACAYVLQGAGHHVTVLDKGDARKGERECGIRSPPNMTRILKDWGLSHWLDEVGVKAADSVFNLDTADTGEKVGILIFHAQIMEALRADLMFLPYGEFWSLLYELAAGAGAVVRLNTKVDKVDPDRPSVWTSTGDEIVGDIIIGADGCESLVRQCVLGEAPEGTVDRRCAFSAAVPTDIMRNEVDLVSLTEDLEWTTWMGDGRAIHGHLSSGKQQYTLNLVLPIENNNFHEHWDDEYSVEELNLNLDAFEPKVRKLVNLARAIVPTKYVHREPYPSLVHENGKVLLVGDAAHPLPPDFTHNAALAIEDAVTLGNLFGRLTSRDQAVTLVMAFEEIRQPRSIQVYKSERGKFDFISVPFGAEQKTRDDGLRSALAQALLDWDNADEGYLRASWEDFIAMWNHDASEVADDWWIKWGSLMSGTTR